MDGPVVVGLRRRDEEVAVEPQVLLNVLAHVGVIPEHDRRRDLHVVVRRCRPLRWPDPGSGRARRRRRCRAECRANAPWSGTRCCSRTGTMTVAPCSAWIEGLGIGRCSRTWPSRARPTSCARIEPARADQPCLPMSKPNHFGLGRPREASTGSTPAAARNGPTGGNAMLEARAAWACSGSMGGIRPRIRIRRPMGMRVGAVVHLLSRLERAPAEATTTRCARRAPRQPLSGEDRPGPTKSSHSSRR